MTKQDEMTAPYFLLEDLQDDFELAIRSHLNGYFTYGEMIDNLRGAIDHFDMEAIEWNQRFNK